MARYKRIKKCRQTGQWDVEKSQSPLSKFCRHIGKIRDMESIHTGTFHDLQRTCLSNLIVQGFSLHEVKELAGHTDIEIIERFYYLVRLLRVPSKLNIDLITFSVSNFIEQALAAVVQ